MRTKQNQIGVGSTVRMSRKGSKSFPTSAGWIGTVTRIEQVDLPTGGTTQVATISWQVERPDLGMSVLNVSFLESV